MLYSRSWQLFSANGQSSKYFSFKGHKVSVKMTQFYHHSRLKAALDGMQMNKLDSVPKEL